MKTYLLDVRTSGEFQNAHIDGSVNIPMDEIPDNLDKIREIKEHIIIICHSGARAHSVQSFFRQNGISNSEVLEGGIVEHGINPEIFIKED